MPNDLLFLCFSCGITDNTGAGNFRRHVKIQQSVVLRCCFGCFTNPLAKQSHIRDFSEETVFVMVAVVLVKTAVTKSLLVSMITQCLPHAGFWSIIADSSAQDEFIFIDGYPFKTWPTKIQFILISVPVYLYFSVIISTRSTFPLSPGAECR